jgi:hypothetical protein
MKQVSMILFVAISSCLLSGQQHGNRKPNGQKVDFLIDVTKPYVYLELDHVGPRQPRGKDEPSVGIYLRLRNNSRLPIVVSMFGGPPGSPECDIMDEVVPNRRLHLTVSGGRSIFAPPPPEVPKQDPPIGYEGDLRTAVPIPPGGHVFFSLPINHVSPTWHLEIPFEFDLPRTHQPHRQPVTYVDFFDDDLPLKDRAATQSTKQ